MQEQEISIQIEAAWGGVQGIKVETSGFTGKACSLATTGVEKAFGGVAADRKWKPEADTPVVAVRADQGTHLRL